MMKLPEKFQFRNKGDEGYTHTAGVEDSRVKVRWARGWFESRGEDWHNEMDELWTTCTVKQAQEFMASGGWIVVEDKKVEQALPDEFYFTCFEDPIVYKATREGEKYRATWDSMLSNFPVYYKEEQFVSRFNSGDWKIIDHKPLTPEQLRSNAEVQDQISALEHNIKLRKQDVEHAEILIANYEGRIKVLRSKLVKES